MIVESIKLGKEYLDANKEESSQVLSKFFNMSKDEEQDGFEGIQILGLKDNIEAMNKSSNSNSNTSSLYQSGDIIAKYLLDRGQIRQIPDFDKIIDPQFVYTIYENNNKIVSSSSMKVRAKLFIIMISLVSISIVALNTFTKSLGI